MSEVLSINNLCKSFGKRQVVKNLSFSVSGGEIYGFLGPNGAGKTTTIKMITGFLFADEGEIVIDGYNLNEDYEKAMNLVGAIVENPEMYVDLSGRVNLELYARLHGVSGEAIERVVDMVGMQSRIDDKVKRYSLGMKQRVGLAQALIHKPKLLILDEPTNGLDPTGIKALRDILKYLAHSEGVAVMVSSHQLAEMQLMCDRVGIIENGVLISQKTVEELINGASDRMKYHLKIRDMNGALAALGALAGSGSFVTFEFSPFSEELIELCVGENDVPRVLSALVGAGVAVYSFAPVEGSLEEAYIGLTEGGQIL